VSTRYGHVIPVGDPRLGSRWAVRPRLESGSEEASGLQIADRGGE
jgi:hypothetical protein